MAKEFNAELLRPVHLGHLAATRASLGETKAGLGLLDEALRTVENTQERMFEAELFRLRGELLASLGKTLAAEEELQQALTVARSQQARMWELRAAVSLARLKRDQGGQSEARGILGPVIAWFTEGFDTADLRGARVLLDELG